MTADSCSDQLMSLQELSENRIVLGLFLKILDKQIALR